VKLAALLLIAATAMAHADSRAWKVAKDNLPDVPLAVSVDVEVIAKSKIWAKVAPMLLEQNDAKEVIARVKDACNLDVMKSVTSIVFAADPGKDKVAAAYLAMPSVGEKKALACMQAVAGKNKLTVKRDGPIVELNDGKQSVYLGFIGDVVVVAGDWTDKAKVKAWLSGGGAFGKGALAKLLAKASAGATVIAGTTATKQIAGAAPDVQVAYGWATIGGGKVVAEVHADYGNVTTASNDVVDTNKALAQTAANPPLPSLKPILSAMTITAAGSEMVIKDNVSEADIVALLDAVLAFTH
jgi:hypothetical protein